MGRAYLSRATNIMKICDDGHDEVVYECRYCPVCEMRKLGEMQVDILKDEISTLNDTIKDQDGEIQDLNSRL